MYACARMCPCLTRVRAHTHTHRSGPPLSVGRVPPGVLFAVVPFLGGRPRLPWRSNVGKVGLQLLIRMRYKASASHVSSEMKLGFTFCVHVVCCFLRLTAAVPRPGGRVRLLAPSSCVQASSGSGLGLEVRVGTSELGVWRPSGLCGWRGSDGTYGTLNSSVMPLTLARTRIS